MGKNEQGMTTHIKVAKKDEPQVRAGCNGGCNSTRAAAAPVDSNSARPDGPIGWRAAG